MDIKYKEESAKNLTEEQKKCGSACETENVKKKQEQKNVQKSVSAKSKAADFKRKYYDYYDDVKDHTKGREDW